jgi:hypothetical protein
VPLSKNKTVAQHKLGLLLGNVDRAKAGNDDHYAEHRQRPLADYEADLKAKQRGAKYVRSVLANVRRDVTACWFKFYAEVSTSRKQKCLADMGRRVAIVGL